MTGPEAYAPAGQGRSTVVAELESDDGVGTHALLDM
jgi:hypothetical protein